MRTLRLSTMSVTGDRVETTARYTSEGRQGRLPSVWLGWWQTCLRSRYRDVDPPAISRRMRETTLATEAATHPTHNEQLHTVQVTLEVTCSRFRAFWQQSNREVIKRRTAERTHARLLLARVFRATSIHRRSRPPPRTRRYSSGSGLSRCSTPIYNPPTSPR